MRVTFDIELTTDIPLSDTELKKTFIGLVCSNARLLYSQSAILSKKPPALRVNMVDADGRTSLDIFKAAAIVEDEEDVI